jgi:RNA polymerase sigma-70 factor (ECF subfamily)
MGIFYNAADIVQGSQETAPVSLDASLTEFYLENRLAIYRHLVFLGVMPGESQELVQDAFLALYRVLVEGENVENWRAWVFRAARNLAFNRLKAAGPAASVAGSEDAIVSEADDPEKLAIASQQREQISKAIAALSPQQRDCLQLRAEGFAYREIAAMMRLKPSTVGEFLRRAIRHLRKAGL